MISKSRLDRLRTGLVLAGGGAKGAYQAGVLQTLDALMLRQTVRVVSGCSIGAINSLLFTVKSPSIYAKIWKTLTYDKMFAQLERAQRASLYRMLRDRGRGRDKKLNDWMRDNGLGTFSQEGIEGILDQIVNYKSLRLNGPDIYACVYDIADSAPKYLYLNDLSDQEIKRAVMASSAVPLVYPPVNLGGRRYSDGGISNSPLGLDNADNAPILPLMRYKLDLMILVYLAGEDRIDLTPYRKRGVDILELVPSRPLEAFKGAGTFDLTPAAIRDRLELGRRDSMMLLAPYVVRLLAEGKGGAL